MSMKKNGLINEALKLRNENHSLKSISENLRISKSTASLWLKNTPKKNKEISKIGREKILDALKRGRETSVKNKKSIPIHKLKFSRSVRHRIFEKRGKVCEICGWSNKNLFYDEIPVQVHHIDGNKKNNSENNLQVLCPSCHSLTEHYGFFGRTHKKSC